MKVGDIWGFKVLDGAEIVGKIKSMNDDAYTLDNPIVIIVGMNQQTNQPSVGLSPYSTFAKGEIVLRENAVVFTFEPETELINAYNKAYGSGIILPEQGIIANQR